MNINGVINKVNPNKSPLVVNGANTRSHNGLKQTAYNKWRLGFNGNLFAPPEVGSVLYLPGNPGFGSTIFDFSGQGNNGTITGATWTRLPSGLWYLGVDGVNGSGIVFSGGNIVIADNTPWTFQTWLNPSAITNKAIYGNLYTVGNYTRFILWTTTIYCYNDANDSANWAVAPTANTWQLVTITCDGAATATLTLYFNTASQGTNTLADTSQTIRVLGNIGDGTYAMLGGMALSRILDGKAQSSTEVADTFNQERHLFNV